MDTGTLITGLVALFICLLPFIFVAQHRKKARQALQNQLFQFANSQSSRIGYFEQWNNAAMGLNEQQTALFYVNVSKMPFQSSILLADLAVCRVHVTRSGKGDAGVTQRIALQFRFNNTQSDMEWPFYDNQVDPVMQSGELELAKNWEKRIADLLPA